MRKCLKEIGVGKYARFTGLVSAFGSVTMFTKNNKTYKMPTICIEDITHKHYHVVNHTWAKFNNAFKKFGYGKFTVGTKIKFSAKIVKYKKRVNENKNKKVTDYGLIITEVRIVKR